MSGLGWFQIDGVQDGPRTVREQLTGLDLMMRHARGAAVLDLGCAEGLISRHLCESGARLAHGIEANGAIVAVAIEACRGWPIEIMRGDLRDLPAISALPILPRYEMVLALSILHKVPHPDRLLAFAAARSADWFAIRLPARVLCDPRSGNRPFDIPALLLPDFALIAEPSGPRGEWVGIFRRVP